MELRKPYSYDTNKASLESAHVPSGISKTKQNQKEESDINNIVRKFGLTGQLPSNVKMPQYGDFTEVTDYQSALNQVISAQTAFMAMPAEIRKRFHHDPQELLEFVSDERNRQEAEKMGIVIKREVEVKTGETVTPEAKPKGEPAASQA